MTRNASASPLGRAWRRLRALVRRDGLDLELDEELRFHVERQIESNLASGMSRDEAKASALREFGGLEQSREACRDARGVRWASELTQDARFGVRRLAKAPGFTLVAVLTLALGVGATTAIFGVVNAVLLRPLPFPEPDRIVSVLDVNAKTGGDGFPVSYPDYYDWRSRQHCYTALASVRQRGVTLAIAGGAPARVDAATVTADFFPLLGVTPALGRPFEPAEERAGGEAVVLGDALWRDRFGADPSVVGRTVSIDGRSHTVVGVMPAGFTFPVGTQPVQLWTSAAMDDEQPFPVSRARGWHGIEVFGRLAPGISIDSAQADVAGIDADLRRTYPGENVDMMPTTAPYARKLVGGARSALLLFLAAVACVLMIACANVANLLLAQSAGRQREMSVRSALGAGLGRVARQILTESLVLSLAGGLCGVALAYAGIGTIVGLVPGGVPRIAEASIDPRVLGVSLALSVGIGLLFGLAPLVYASKLDVVSGLKDGGRGSSAGSGALRFRSALVTAQVAVTFVLLVGAGLMLSSYRNLLGVKPGFSSEQVSTLRVSLPETSYASSERAAAFYSDLVARVGALPGVTSVAATNSLPLSGDTAYAGLAFDGEPVDPGNRHPHATAFRIVTPGFFRTMGTDLVRGRDFDAHDVRGGAPVAIVNEAFARAFLGGDAVGRRVEITVASDEKGPAMREIVGVTRDANGSSIAEAAAPECYVPFLEVTPSSAALVVQSSNEPGAVGAAVAGEVRAIDPEIPVFAVAGMSELVSRSVAQPRFHSLVLALFAGAALLLTAIGLYGVLAWSVAQRTRELGVRVALGASGADVTRLVVRQGLWPVVVGLGIGALAALALGRLVEGYLFRVTATDPATFAVIAAILLGVGAIACAVPARRATRVDPLVALRAD